MRRRISPGRKREFAVFCVLSGLAFAAFAGLIVYFSSREEARRRLDLEYQVWQVSSAFIEYFESPSSVESTLPFKIQSFGLYDDTGRAISRSSDAPAMISVEEFSGERVEFSGGSVRLIRRLGQPGMGRGGGRNRFDPGDPAEGPAPKGRLRDLEPGSGQTQDPGSLRRAGRILLIDLPAGDFERKETLFRVALVILLSTLGCFYALIVWLYRRTIVLAEREERNRELVQLGEAARTLAHEIKNPLGIIRLQCVTLSKLLPEERKANLDIIGEETERLRALTDKIGDFLRSQRGEPRAIGLSEWSRDFAARNGLAWSSEVKGSGEVFIDPDRLESVMGNLVSNAKEAGGGDGGLEVRLGREGGRVRLDMLDRGPGVPPEMAERIFDPFFTTKAKGSGIGLSLARKFAQEAGGWIEYRKRDGGGSQFSLYLPLRGHKGS